MGRDKAMLPFGSGPGAPGMLQRVVQLVAEAVPRERIVCVAAHGQPLPPLDVKIVRDPIPACGPLAGLATGLAVLGAAADAAFACGCDVPLLAPAFVARMFEFLGDYDIAIPHDGQRDHPLAAVYRVDVLPVVESLLSEGERSLVALAQRCRTLAVPVEQLRDVDPELLSLAPCNTPDDYRQSLARAHER